MLQRCCSQSRAPAALTTTGALARAAKLPCSSSSSSCATGSIRAVGARAWSQQQQPQQQQHAHEQDAAVGTSSSHHMLQQQLAASSAVLDWSAAAPRPAQPPEHMEASSSSSSRSTSSRSSRRSRSSMSIRSERQSSNSADLVDGVGALAEPEAAATYAASQHQPRSTSNGNGSTADSSSSSSSSSSAESLGKQLMLAVTRDCSSVQQLADLVAARSQDFSAQHCAAALHRLATTWQQLQQEAQRSGDGAVQQQQALRRAELRQQYAQCLQLAEVLLGGLQQQVAAAQARDVADALHAVLKLGVPVVVADGDADAAPVGSGAVQYRSFVGALLQQAAVLLRRGQFGLLQLSRVLCSCSHLGLQLSADWWSLAIETAAVQLEQLQEQPDGASSSSHAQSVAELGWAVAKLQAPASTAWWACYEAAAQRLLPAMTGSELSIWLWTLATAAHAPSTRAMAAFWAASEQQLQHMAPQGLANTMWAAAVLQQRPPAAWLARFQEAAATGMHEFRLQHVAMTLWGMGKLAESWPESAAGGPSSSSSSSSQSSSSSGSASTPLQPPAWLDQAWVQLAAAELDAGASQALACTLWGLTRLQVAVPAERLQQLEAMAVEVMAEASPQAIVVIVWALGQLRGPSTSRSVLKRLRRVCSSQPALLQQLPPQGLCMLLHGLSRMRAWQPDSFKQQLLDAVAARLAPLQQQQQQRPDTRAASAAGSGEEMLSAGSLPIVLVCLKQLRVPVPTELLQAIEAQLGQQASAHPSSTGQLCLTLFALGASRHAPEPAFLQAAVAQLDAQPEPCSSKDAAHALYGLAAMAAVSLSCREVLATQQEQLQRLLLRAEQVLPHMSHASLAMMLWALARLQLRPRESLMQAALAATLRALPGASLLSITSILAALRRLEYLPPLPWMVEVCGAARAKVGSDASPTAWQRKDCVRRFEEAVTWFNEACSHAAAQAGGASPTSSIGSPTSSRDELDESSGDAGQQQQQQRARQQRQKARMSQLANSSSEGLIAAAVGVAAAVAQQWHP